MERLRIEIHTHTKYSQDSLLGKLAYLLILKLKKIKVVGITDHNTIKGAIEYKKFLEKYGIKVIVGEEIMTNKGEIIGLFLKEEITAGLTPKKTIAKIKNQNGVVYIPHPYDKKRNKTVLILEEIERNKENIDIIECHNGRNVSFKYSERQNEIAEKFKKLKMIGSDAHIFFELGRNYNLIRNFSTKDEFLECLKDIKYSKKKCLKFSHEITKVVKLFKIFLKGDYDELFRVIRKTSKRRK